MHYYQRWAENDRAKSKAAGQAQDTSERQLHRLSELTATPTSQLKFICDAWDQVCLHELSASVGATRAAETICALACVSAKVTSAAASCVIVN